MVIISIYNQRFINSLYKKISTYPFLLHGHFLFFHLFLMRMVFLGKPNKYR